MNLSIEILITLFLWFSSENSHDPESAQFTAPVEDVAPVTVRPGMRIYAMRLSIEQDDLANLRAGDVVNVFIPTFLAVPEYSQAERFQGTYMVKNLLQSVRVLAIEPQESTVESAFLVEVLISLEVEPDYIPKLMAIQQNVNLPDISQERDIRFSETDRGVYGPEIYTEVKRISLPQGVSGEQLLILKPEGASLPEFCESCTTISVDTFFERADIGSVVCFYFPLADGSRWSRFPCPESQE